MLLGLLTTLPAATAPIDSFAGTIEFLDATRASPPVTYVSLNGPASTVGIQLRITDKDLDVIIKREGDNADVLDATRQSSGQVQPLVGEEWFDLQDMNGDGRVDRRDIRALDSAGNNVVTESETIWYDGTNGVLRVPVNTAKLEYWIKTKTTLGSGSAAQQSGRERQGQEALRLPNQRRHHSRSRRTLASAHGLRLDRRVGGAVIPASRHGRM